MKWLWKSIAVLALLYVLIWSSAALYFSYADGYKSKLESHLSSIFKRPVSIDSIETSWQEWSPTLEVKGLKVAGDDDTQAAFAFESLFAKASPESILKLWPIFTDFDIKKPIMEVKSFADGRLQVAGFSLDNHGANNNVSQKLVSWLLDQKNASWEQGEIIWRKEDRLDKSLEVKRFQDISMQFKRVNQQRELKTSVLTPKGSLSFIANTNGDLLSANNWNASLEVLGDEGESLLRPEDFSVKVDDGKGKVTLKTLDVEHIRDFIRLSGLVNDARWLLDAKLAGRLHDVKFGFSGPLLSVDTWELNASASGVGFDSVGRAPAMNNLSGELNASKDGGKFTFIAQDSEFQWSQWYANGFQINRASGDFIWGFSDNGEVLLNLRNGEFEDPNARISDVFLSTKVSYKASRVSTLADMFKVKSIEDLSFDGGELVRNSDVDNELKPLIIDVQADFELFDISQVVNYLPNDERLRLFRKWSDKGFAAGELSNGTMRYQGELSKTALKDGNATLQASADFDKVTIDYAPENNWPAAKGGKGKATLNNQLLTIIPDELSLNGDQITEGELTITNLFQRDRTLNINAKFQTTLVKGINFLFRGPLIKPEDQLSELPFIASEGSVDIDINVAMVLNNIRQTQVSGAANVQNGKGHLTGPVPIDDISGLVVFTESKVSSENIKANFLGGETSGRLITLKEAQPPVMKLLANGVAKTQALQPWVGEHVLSLFEGSAPWQGSVTIDDGRVDIAGESNLLGVAVSAPEPLRKIPQEKAPFSIAMTVGGSDVKSSLSVAYKEKMLARFKSNGGNKGSLFDNSILSVGSDSAAPLKPGVNFLIEENQVNLDDWLTTVIDLASLETTSAESVDSSFLDAMRSINISVKDPILLGYKAGSLNITAVSVDGLYWIGTLDGQNVDGTMQLQPRDDVGHYSFKLDYLNLDKQANENSPVEPIDYSLSASDFPSASLEIQNFRFEGKNLGHLKFDAKPVGNQWNIEQLTLQHNGIETTASGYWKNTESSGSLTNITFNTNIDAAEDALNDMDFDGFIRKGKGKISGELRWIGAPHEFDYSRLNGRFDASVKDGELVKVEPGGGKLLGLLNFNAIARRLVFDFRDVFASGLQFDRMRYAGILADGEVIFTDAFIFSPAVFARMEGKLDLSKELIDMEVHISPELGGNLALLSALANPAAGAVVFITQRLFKDEMRNSSFMSYRALGTWEDFEMLEMKNGEVVEKAPAKTLESIDSAEDLSEKLDSSVDVNELEPPLQLEKLEANPIEEADAPN